MKRTTILAVFFILLSLTAHAQQLVYCNGATGNVAIPGTMLTVPCPNAPQPVTCQAPLKFDPTTNTCKPPQSSTAGCSASQISTPINGKTFQRQCAGSVVMQPSGVGGSIVDLTDLGPLFGNKPFPVYLYSGQSPTFFINSNFYVALAFTPNANGLIKFTANNSYGAGGAISLSTFAGGLTYGAPGVICALASGGLNSMIVSTTTGSCRVALGQTYYINFADTNANGDQFCSSRTADGTCTQSRVSYAFTARAQ